MPGLSPSGCGASAPGALTLGRRKRPTKSAKANRFSLRDWVRACGFHIPAALPVAPASESLAAGWSLEHLTANVVVLTGPLPDLRVGAFPWWAATQVAVVEPDC